MNTIKLRCLALIKDTTIRQVILSLHKTEDWDIILFEEVSQLISALDNQVNLLIVEEISSSLNYLQIVKRVRRKNPSCEIMVIGGPKSNEVFERDRSSGVDCFFARPVEPENLRLTIEHCMRVAWIKSKAGMIGRSSFIAETVESLILVAPTEVPILIQGESGTGKDVLAKAVHLASKRRDKPFEAINCGSLAEGVLESELFGHEKGAFTGAIAQRKGLFERADGGSVFLDEVAEMSSNMQVRLLRVLESGEVLRVGGIKSFNVDVRIIAATNRHLADAVRKGEFRQDLYYRLRGISFQIPPLRERTEDIPILVNKFIIEASKKHEKSIRGIDAEALKILMGYSWPGNIRELRNMVDTLVVLTAEDRIKASNVAAQLKADEKEAVSLLPVAANRTKAEAEREMIYASILALHRDVREILGLLGERSFPDKLEGMREVSSHEPLEPQVETLAQKERNAIQEVLRATGGNRRKAAAILGISERTLYRKINEYALL